MNKEMKVRHNIKSNCVIGSDITTKVPYLKVIVMENEKVKLETTYIFKETTESELLKRRLNQESLCVMKYGEKLFYSIIEKNHLTTGRFGSHLCRNCKNLSSQKCEKVARGSADLKCSNNSIWQDVVKNCNKIESMNFINMGIETVNTQVDSYAVVECKNFEKIDK